MSNAHASSSSSSLPVPIHRCLIRHPRSGLLSNSARKDRTPFLDHSASGRCGKHAAYVSRCIVFDTRRSFRKVSIDSGPWRSDGIGAQCRRINSRISTGKLMRGNGCRSRGGWGWVVVGGRLMVDFWSLKPSCSLPPGIIISSSFVASSG